MLEGLFFSFCAVVPIFITFGGVPNFKACTTASLYFYFSIFSKWALLLLVRVKHRKTLYRFLLMKNKGWGKNNKDRNSETRQTDKK